MYGENNRSAGVPKERTAESCVGGAGEAQADPIDRMSFPFLRFVLYKRLNGFCSEVSSVLGTSADFQGAVTDLNWSINSGHPIGETLGRLLGRVFLPKGMAAALGHPGPLYQQARQELGANGQGAGFWTRSLNVKKQTDPMIISGAKESTELFSQTETNLEEPEIVIMDYSGPSLPDNTTMDRYNLHLEQTVSLAGSF